ncbi:hypothetical protein ALO84_200138 [Pseudomonas syringae pv. maculicola]|nr:hypothetical protein ALO84_200138 [Pseudomonas syringae pv. maculicola]RML71118.1 hypothetical protein ALQ91_200100 [Pseudomonas syringae pv. syringae]
MPTSPHVFLPSRRAIWRRPVGRLSSASPLATQSEIVFTKFELGTSGSIKTTKSYHY